MTPPTDQMRLRLSDIERRFFEFQRERQQRIGAQSFSDDIPQEVLQRLWDFHFEVQEVFLQRTNDEPTASPVRGLTFETASELYELFQEATRLFDVILQEVKQYRHDIAYQGIIQAQWEIIFHLTPQDGVEPVAEELIDWSTLIRNRILMLTGIALDSDGKYKPTSYSLGLFDREEDVGFRALVDHLLKILDSVINMSPTDPEQHRAALMALLLQISLPKRNNDENTAEDLPDCCAVCLEAWKKDDDIRMMPCHPSHMFHQRCLATWLPVSLNCPLCRSTPRIHFVPPVVDHP